MKIKMALLTVLCVTSFVKGSEQDDRLTFEKEPTRVIPRSASRSVVQRQSQWWDHLPTPCAAFFRCLCCCCKRPDIVVVVDDSQVRPARSSTDLQRD